MQVSRKARASFRGRAVRVVHGTRPVLEVLSAAWRDGHFHGRGSHRGSHREIRRLIGAIVSEMTRHKIQNVLELKHEDHFRKAYLLPALEANLIEMTIPGKPKSSKQRYRLTPSSKTIRARSIGSDS